MCLASGPKCLAGFLPAVAMCVGLGSVCLSSGDAMCVCVRDYNNVDYNNVGLGGDI